MKVALNGLVASNVWVQTQSQGSTSSIHIWSAHNYMHLVSTERHHDALNIYTFTGEIQ